MDLTDLYRTFHPNAAENTVFLKHTWNFLKGRTYSGILLSRYEILPLATTWMDLENSVLSEISQAEKDRRCLISLTCEVQKCQTCKNRVDLWLPGVVDG